MLKSTSNQKRKKQFPFMQLLLLCKVKWKIAIHESCTLMWFLRNYIINRINKKMFEQWKKKGKMTLTGIQNPQARTTLRDDLISLKKKFSFLKCFITKVVFKSLSSNYFFSNLSINQVRSFNFKQSKFLTFTYVFSKIHSHSFKEKKLYLVESISINHRNQSVHLTGNF